MTTKSFEWKLALDAAGASKTTKGFEKEILGMKKTFESLNKINLFAKGQADLKNLEKQLSSARVKMAEAGKAAETGGARQQKAYQKTAAEVDKLNKAIRTQTGDLAKQSAALKASGVNTKKLTEEQERAELAYKASSTQLKASAAAQKQFDTLGIRSSKQVRAEQAARVDARRKLAASGKASAADLVRADKAVAAGARRVKDELSGVRVAGEDAGIGVGKLAGALVAVASARAAITTIKAGIQEVIRFANEQEKQETKLQSVIKATGQAAGFTAEQIYDYADSIQKTTIYGDEATIAGAAILATFKEIKDVEFGRTLEVAHDLSTVLRSDLKSSVLQLGKSLEDPKNGLTALRRAGISFNDTERDTIKALQDSGQLRLAQIKILDKVEAQVGGASHAMRETYGGAVIAADNAYGDLLEEIGFFITKNKEVKEVIGITEDVYISLTNVIEKYRKSEDNIIKNSVKFVAENKALVGGLVLVAAGFGIATAAITLYNTGIGAAVIANTAAAASAVASAALIALPYAVIAASIVSVGIAVKEGIAAYDAHKMAAESAAGASEQWAKFEAKRSAASAAVGHELKTYQDIQAAYKSGALDYDELTKTYSKGDGVPRKAAGEHKEAAVVVADSAGKAAAAVKKSAEIQELSLDDAKKEWLEYASQIKDINNQIEGIGSFGGGNLQGLQQINGEWQYFATNTETAKAAMAGFNNTSQLGLSSLKDSIFELSLAGKSDIEVWNDRKRAAEQYTQAAKATAAEAQQLAGAGQRDEANRKFAQSIEIAKKAESAYKSLATEVKTEWTPAMDAAHKSAAEGVKAYETAASKAMSEATKHYDKARAAGDKLADRQQNLADKLRDIGLAGKSPIAAYQGMASSARQYEASAKAALAAGDFGKAIADADRAASAWDSLGNEVKDGERVAVSAKQALAAQASGIKSSGDIAIKALKAQQAAEQAAGKAAEEKAKKATAAKEAEAKKIVELEKQKEQVIISAEAGAQAAAAGTLEANQLIIDVLDKQKTAIGEVADALNRQAEWSLGDTFTDAGGSLKGFDDALATFDGNWNDVWTSMRTKGEEDIDALEVRLDKLVAEKRVVVVEIKEVAGASSGTVAGVSGASSGAIVGRYGQHSVKDGAAGFRVPGWGGGDTLRHLYALEGGEPVTNKHSARHFDYPFFKKVNAGDEVGAAKHLAGRFPALQAVFAGAQQPISPIILPPALQNTVSPASRPGEDEELKGLLRGLMRVKSVDYVDGSEYDYLMTPAAYAIQQARQERHKKTKERLNR